MKKVQVLGTGCPDCDRLAELVEATARELHLDLDVEKVSDIGDILSYGVAATPALVVDGTVKMVGGLPSPEELRAMLA